MLSDGDPELAFWNLAATFFNAIEHGHVLYRYVVLGKVRHMCFEDSPWQLWAWEKCESTISRRPLAEPEPLPTIQVPAHLLEPGVEFGQREAYVCKEMHERFGTWGTKPFVVKGLVDGTDLLEDKDTWTMEWIAENAGKEKMSVIDMEQYREQWDSIKKCPFKRFDMRSTKTVKEVIRDMQNNTELYVAFAETFFGDTDIARPDLHEKLEGQKKKRAEYMRRMSGVNQIWDMCAGKDKVGRSFSGFSGEIFFGRAYRDQRQPNGAPAHAAFMRNLFLQMRGKRAWRLWSPRYSQFMRIQAFIGYISGTGAHQNWDAGDPDAFGLNSTYADHIHHIPSYTVDLGPGDLLYVPPWWWHDTKIHGGYSLGISARGQDWGADVSLLWGGTSIANAPSFRFLPFFDGWNGLDAMVFDAFQVAPIVYGDKLSGRRHGFVELRQGAKAR